MKLGGRPLKLGVRPWILNHRFKIQCLTPSVILFVETDLNKYFAVVRIKRHQNFSARGFMSDGVAFA